MHRLIFFFLALSFLSPLFGQSEPSWQRYLTDQVKRIADQNQFDLKEITSESWPKTRNRWREELQDMLGLSPWPEKVSLEATTSRRFEVDGVSIENIHYQSSPGLYVAANLYLPKSQRPKSGWPAVLYVCGHANVTENGRLLGNKTSYQHHGLWLARHGIACLIIDTIQLGEFHGEHHGTYKLGRWDWITRGYTPAGVEAWNAIRAIDYLVSREEIDPQKIGITGRSGGGAYSWFAAALDDRIQVAVPVAGITDLQNHVIDGCVEGHCDCMYFVNTYRWDYAKLAAVIAPRPLLLTNTDSDSIFPLDGVMRIHRQVADVYRRLNQSTNYGVLIGPGPHKDTQELQVGAFKWLIKHLTGNEIVIEEAAKKEIETNELVAFPQETPIDQRVTSAAGWFVKEAPSVADSNLAQSSAREFCTRLIRDQASRTSKQDSPKFKQLFALESTSYRYSVNEFLSNSDWNPSWIEITPTISQKENRPVVVHLGGFQNLNKIDAAQLEKLTTEGPYSEAIRQQPDATHVILLPRGWDLAAEVQNPRKLTQVHRRFYLIGDSLELLQINDAIAMLPMIGSRAGKSRELQLMGHHRSGWLAIILGIESQSESSLLPRITRLILSDLQKDPRFVACIPGMLKHIHLETLLTAARNSVPTEFMHSTANNTLTHLVETSYSPQQATGIRIVEVTRNSAVVWSRATRWPLPNLGDFAEIAFERDERKGANRNSGAILPPDGVAGLQFACPGVRAEMRVRYHRVDGDSLNDPWIATDWKPVDPESDYSLHNILTGLKEDSVYELRVEARGIGSLETSSTLTGQFKTLPNSGDAKSVRIAIGTCQEFTDRDGPHGFDAYRTMLKRKTDYFFMAGDVVYYDKLARNNDLAHYHWQRTYGLPTLVHFHKQIPSYFLKDDHDTYVNDSWPNKKFDWTDAFTFEDGQRIFRQQTGLPTPAYRTLVLSRDLQIWLLEGRDFRSPNTNPDSPEKSILGNEQKAWLKQTLEQSSAKYRMILSPTPIVGPDRENKKDNLSNSNFQYEGEEIRQFLKTVPGTFVVCGDRHWQYHSIDPVTRLNEFSVGPISNRHAGGWKKDDFRKDYHQFLRVGGGYWELTLNYDSGQPKLIGRHLDPYGKETHRAEW